MTTFPVKLFTKSVMAVCIAIIAIQVFIRPLTSKAVIKGTEIFDYYSSSNKSALDAAQKQRASFQEIEKKIAALVNTPGKSAASYDFLQEFLRKHNVQTVKKITGAPEESSKRMTKNDFTIQYDGNYHTLGSLVSDLENGPFICRISSLHAVSKSPINSNLGIEFTASFYRISK
jgi:Tfp pilus assembly protein PilO